MDLKFESTLYFDAIKVLQSLQLQHPWQQAFWFFSIRTERVWFYFEATFFVPLNKS